LTLGHVVLDSVADSLGWLELEIKITARVYGHVSPWPNGTIVTFAKHMSVVGGQGFRRLSVHKDDDDRWVKLPYESVGIVNDHKNALEEYASQVNVNAGKLSSPAYQWYWVAFNEEILWVRCDWLRPWVAPQENVET
jgi:hypothetical protein